MHINFLEYYKTILRKVSFDPGLLVKEYHKASKYLIEDELDQLNLWMEAEGLKAIAPQPAKTDVLPHGRLAGPPEQAPLGTWKLKRF